MAIADRLREARYKAGLTQAEAAEKLFVTRQLISKWEHGTCEPAASLLVRCAQLYQVPLDYLCGLADETSQGADSSLSEATHKWKERISGIMAAFAAHKRAVFAGMIILALAIGWIIGSHSVDRNPRDEIPTYNQDELPITYLDPSLKQKK